MTISQLVEYVGNENVDYQLLEGDSGSLIKAHAKKKDGEITFATDKDKVMALAGLGKQTHRCMILWLPLDKMPGKDDKPKASPILEKLTATLRAVYPLIGRGMIQIGSSMMGGKLAIEKALKEVEEGQPS